MNTYWFPKCARWVFVYPNEPNMQINFKSHFLRQREFPLERACTFFLRSLFGSSPKGKGIPTGNPGEKEKGDWLPMYVGRHLICPQTHFQIMTLERFPSSVSNRVHWENRQNRAKKSRTHISNLDKFTFKRLPKWIWKLFLPLDTIAPYSERKCKDPH